MKRILAHILSFVPLHIFGLLIFFYVPFLFHVYFQNGDFPSVHHTLYFHEKYSPLKKKLYNAFSIIYKLLYC